MTRSLSRSSLLAIPLALSIALSLAPAAVGAGGSADLRRPSLTFVENRGQWPEPVRYAAGFGPATSWVLERGVLVDLIELGGPDGEVGRGCALEFAFDGEGEVALHAAQPRPGRHNYLIGDDPEGWAMGVGGFGRLRFEDLWPGIDVVLREGQGLFEYDLQVAPRADLGAARIEVKGAQGLSIDERGRLRIATGLGPLLQSAPVAWSVSAEGLRSPVRCRFRLLDEGAYGFEALDARAGEALVVDPGLLWSTYLGDLDHDIARALALAPGGDVVCAGSTFSPAFPTTLGVYDFVWNGAFDAFVTRLAADGSSLVWSTFLGGAGQDNATALAVAADGAVVVGGDTTSQNFPTSAGAFDNGHNGGLDGFVARLHPGGTWLLASTYLGSSASERLSDLELDASGRVLVCGSTGSGLFPTTQGSYDTSFGGGSTGAGDVYVTRFVPDLSSLDFSTFLGGSADERAEGLALGSDGNITLAGWTTSSDYPTTSGVVGAALTNAGGQDAFASRLNASGQALVWSTYLGGSAKDAALDVTLLSNQDSAIVGRTYSTDFPITSLASQTVAKGLEESFVTRLSADAKLLAYSTYLGGSQDDQAQAVALLEDDSIAVTGRTSSPDIAVQPWVFDTKLGGIATSTEGDAFVFRYDKQGILEYATYFGGGAEEIGLDIVSDGQGGVLFCGETNSGDLPTPFGGFDISYDYSTVPDGFLSHLDFARFPFSYGTPKINSYGGWAVLLTSDFPSLAENDMTVWVSGAISYGYGWMFWSDQAGSVPFAGGELLMLPPYRRQQFLNFNIFGSDGVTIPIDASMVGTTRYYQTWYYDANDPWRVGLSEGMEIQFYP